MSSPPALPAPASAGDAGPAGSAVATPPTQVAVEALAAAKAYARQALAPETLRA